MTALTPTRRQEIVELEHWCNIVEGIGGKRDAAVEANWAAKHFRALMKDRADLLASDEALRKEVDRLKIDYFFAQGQVSQLESEISVAKEVHDAKDAEIADWKQLLSEANAHIRIEQAEMDRVTKFLGEVRGKYSAAIAEIAGLRAELVTCRNTAKINLSVATKSLEDARRLREALRPFAQNAENWALSCACADNEVIGLIADSPVLTVGDLRRAHTALTEQEEKPSDG